MCFFYSTKIVKGSLKYGKLKYNFYRPLYLFDLLIVVQRHALKSTIKTLVVKKFRNVYFDLYETSDFCECGKFVACCPWSVSPHIE